VIPVSTLLAGNGSTFFTGCSKTGIPGASILGVVLLANLMEETRQSVGILLPLLISADLFAVGYYRRHTDWTILTRMLPWTVCGLALGAVALRHIPDGTFAPILGALVLGILTLEIIRQQLQWDHIPHHPVVAALLGITAGFTTTIGNLAGPVMALYLLSLGLDKNRFMGSMAYFFLIINCLKVPIFIFSDMITPDSLRISVQFLPGILLGALIGRWLFLRIPQKPFQLSVQILAGAAAIRLLLS
jgi:uncharacterized membrane protein YfcA